MGKLAIQTTPGAQIVVDGQRRVTADGSGNYVFESIQAGPHAVDIALDKYTPVQGRQVSVTGGQQQTLSAQLSPAQQAPTTGNLAVETNPGATISIDGQRKGTADGSGRFGLEGLTPGQHTIDIALDKYQSQQGRQITISAGQTQNMYMQLTPVPQPQEPAQPKQAVADNGADIQGVEEARERFEAAYATRNVTKVDAEWLNIGKQREKQLDNLFHTFDIAVINEKCSGQPTINGNNAEWHCMELVQFQKGVWPKALPKTLYFVKQGNRWVMKDKIP